MNREPFLTRSERVLATAIRSVAALLLFTCAAAMGAGAQNRPPAVPLITHDPYFSLWSMNDKLTDGPTRHWTRSPQPLIGLARIDGKIYRWMGASPESAAAMKQTALELTPTRTTYRFEQDGVKLECTFLSPVLPADMDLMSRPVSYIAMAASSTDGATHKVQLLLEMSAAFAVDMGTQEVIWSRSRLNGITALRVGNFDQRILARSGDNLRIDWGFAYLAVPDQAGASEAVISGTAAEQSFAAGQALSSDEIDMPQRADRAALGAAEFDFGEVSANPAARHVLLAYDDLYSIEYLGRKMRAYWRRDGRTFGDLLESAEREYHEIDRRAHAFDEALTTDLRQTGGEAYTQLATLAFRQTIAAHKLVADADGAPMLFPKENFSNGCISTVDVIYPSSPFFLLFNPALLEAQLRPLMEYVRTGRWHFPFAPHDLGTYPKADGQIYGGGETTEDDQMPVEESGNMLIMFAALAKAEGSAAFADRYWPELQKWAEYLQKEGMDPANQLSTDDFAGHLAHNSNLSIKAILALDAFAELAGKTGRSQEMANYKTLAKDMAAKWQTLAADGDHFRLAFDKPGTWSQKYNLAWDRVLGFDLFSASVSETEMRFYKAHLNNFGLPLDNRSAYTKLDWEVWTATLAANRQDFDAVLAGIQRFINESPSRVPLTDWYWTTDARQAGFQARSVVGGVYMPLLANADLWKKWLAMKQ